MLIQMGKRSAAAFGATVGVLVACGLVLGYIEGKSTAYLYSLLGWGGILLTGAVGTPIHELGHLLMCKLFGFHVAEVALFRPVAGQADGVLGFVRYSYDPSSLWQRLGCFFVGIAPMVLGAAVILLLIRLLTPEVFQRRRPGTARGLVCLYLVVSISTHMTLSPADLSGAAGGLAVVAALCVVFGIVTTLMGIEVEPVLKKTALSLGAFFGVGIAFALLSLAVFGGLHVVLGL